MMKRKKIHLAGTVEIFIPIYTCGEVCGLVMRVNAILTPRRGQKAKHILS